MLLFIEKELVLNYCRCYNSNKILSIWKASILYLSSYRIWYKLLMLFPKQKGSQEIYLQQCVCWLISCINRICLLQKKNDVHKYKVNYLLISCAQSSHYTIFCELLTTPTLTFSLFLMMCTWLPLISCKPVNMRWIIIFIIEL